MNAITESEGFRNQIVKGFPGTVDKIDVPLGNTTFLPDRIKAESDAGKGTVSLVGGVHGDFPTLIPYLTDLSDVAKDMQKAGIPAELFTLGKLGTNKQVLHPVDAGDVRHGRQQEGAQRPAEGRRHQLAQLRAVLQVGQEPPGALRTTRGRLSCRPDRPLQPLPPGVPDPRVHRPSEHVVQEQVGGLELASLEQLWKYVHPQSLTYNFMPVPLQSGEVMVAWDHVARISNALRDHPDDYVSVPPRRPDRRDVRTCRCSPGSRSRRRHRTWQGAEQLIEFLDTVPAQARLAPGRGFFPVVSARLSKQVGSGLLAITAAVKTQQRSKDALASLLPVGLGAQGATTTASSSTRSLGSSINKEDINKVWRTRAKAPGRAQYSGRPCWKPDPPSTGTCQVGTNLAPMT